jgi:HEPN domain-containing protein
MATLEHAASMLEMARRDHDALAATVDLPQVADSIYGFHAQQAVEKALKAWLALCGERYPLTQDLPRLFSLLRRSGIEIAAFEDLDRFTPYAVQARYEAGDPDEDEALERPAIVAEVEALLTHVARLLDATED